MKAVLFYALVALVVLSPVPIGSNREWSWALCALIAGGLALAWVLFGLSQRWSASHVSGQGEAATGWAGLTVIALFLVASGWAGLQASPWLSEAWAHPLWDLSTQALGTERSGLVSLSAENTRTALMRLLSYAAVFVVAFQLAADRRRAQQLFGILTIAGLVFGVFGLLVYWGGYQVDWLFGERTLPHDVRSTFINRNHFATWQGLTLLVAIAYFYQRMSRPQVMPYSVPQSRDKRVEDFILRAWKPLTALLLMVTALMLTHSRGGFSSALAGTLVLLVLLDRRTSLQRLPDGGPNSRARLSRLLVLSALVVAGLAFFLTSEVLLDRINRTDITTEERLGVYANVNRGIADNPLLGYGYGTFADSFRLYDRNDAPVHYDRAHNTWLENAFELGVPAAMALFLSLTGLALICLRGVFRRHRDWAFPATGLAASVLVGLHATVDFSLQIPAVAILYACVMGVACAQSFSSVRTRY